MTSRTLFLGALLTVVTVGGALAVWGGFGLTQHAIELLDAYKDDAVAAKPAIQSGGAVLATVQGASKAQLDSTASITRDVRAEMWHMDRTLTTLDATLSDYGGIPAHLNGTADAATTLLGTTSTTVAAAQAPINALTPLIGHSDATVSDLDALLKDEALHQTLVNVDLTTASMAEIGADAKKVSGKLTNDFVAPKPWYRKIGPSLSDLWDYGALAARHMP